MTGLRFTQVSPDRAYLVRVVTNGDFCACWSLRRDDADGLLKRVCEDLAALAVERVWLTKCPEECANGAVYEPGDTCIDTGVCPRCEGSPKRGWVVEACPDERCHTDKEWALGCTGCHGTGQHVERMGLVEALGSKTFARFAGRLEADGDFVSSELHPAYHRGRTPDRLTVDDFRWLADALALLTEGPNKKLKIGK